MNHEVSTHHELNREPLTLTCQTTATTPVRLDDPRVIQSLKAQGIDLTISYYDQPPQLERQPQILNFRLTQPTTKEHHLTLEPEVINSLHSLGHTPNSISLIEDFTFIPGHQFGYQASHLTIIHLPNPILYGSLNSHQWSQLKDTYLHHTGSTDLDLSALRLSHQSEVLNLSSTTRSSDYRPVVNLTDSTGNFSGHFIPRLDLILDANHNLTNINPQLHSPETQIQFTRQYPSLTTLSHLIHDTTPEVNFLASQ